MVKGSALALASGLAVATLSSAAGASPADLFGFGPRSQSMAGVGTAVGRGFETTYGNPALLSRTHHRELSLGWQETSFSLHADGPNAPGELYPEALHGEFIGAVLPVPFGGVLEDRVTLGLATFTPTERIARARLLYPERAQFPLLTDRAQSINFNLGLGLDLGYGLRFGAGAMALAELVGTVVVRTDSSGRVGTSVDDQLIATWAPIVGASYETRDGWLAGLVWRGALEAEFDAVIEVHDLGSLVVPNLHITGIAQYDPMQVQAELGKRLGPWTLAVGATYKRWSAFDGWQRPTVQCPASFPDCAALVPEPVAFHDVVVPRVGAIYELELGADAKAELRAGYAVEPSPMSEQTGAANYYDSTRHVVAVGYGLELAEPLPPILLDLFVQQQLLAPRTHGKRAGVAADNPGSPEVDTGGSITNFGVVLGVKF